MSRWAFFVKAIALTKRWGSIFASTILMLVMEDEAVGLSSKSNRKTVEE